MIPTQIHRYGTVKSTNDIAIEMLKHGEPEGTVVTALAQSKGRGRRGRSWASEPGQNAIVSIVLTPHKQPNQLHELSFVAGLGVAEYLANDHAVEVSLKWPNDVMVGDKKIVGILVETAKVSGEWSAVAGIGLNVNQSRFDGELHNRATSIAIETGRQVDVDSVCERLAKRVLEVYEQYITGGFEDILARWTKYMWGVGRVVEVATEARSILGHIEGADDTGALIIKDARGHRHCIRAADTIRVLCA
ncbi:MAG: biotin--[acetyl-CoA-carboxylase] ligase [Armatimonadota bacterium]|nr:biotin--[acetyl-CoA-carboxylase] ligase [bacterium]